MQVPPLDIAYVSINAISILACLIAIKLLVSQCQSLYSVWNQLQFYGSMLLFHVSLVSLIVYQEFITSDTITQRESHDLTLGVELFYSLAANFVVTSVTGWVLSIWLKLRSFNRESWWILQVILSYIDYFELNIYLPVVLLAASTVLTLIFYFGVNPNPLGRGLVVDWSLSFLLGICCLSAFFLILQICIALKSRASFSAAERFLLYKLLAVGSFCTMVAVYCWYLNLIECIGTTFSDLLQRDWPEMNDPYIPPGSSTIFPQSFLGFVISLIQILQRDTRTRRNSGSAASALGTVNDNRKSRLVSSIPGAASTFKNYKYGM